MDYDASLFDESIFDDSSLSELPSTSLDGFVDGNDRIDCLLAAGNISDVPDLRVWCQSLPADSYGQVFIEVFSPIQIEPLQTPPGVGVTWICREQLGDPTLPGIGLPQGQALKTAVDAWLCEWYRTEYGAERHFTLWMGARSNEVMHTYWKSLERQVTSASGDPRR